MHRQEARVVAEGHTVHVAIDRDTSRPIAVPAAFRERIRKFKGAALAEPG